MDQNYTINLDNDILDMIEEPQLYELSVRLRPNFDIT